MSYLNLCAPEAGFVLGTYRVQTQGWRQELRFAPSSYRVRTMLELSTYFI
jgi:hypothetical protein